MKGKYILLCIGVIIIALSLEVLLGWHLHNINMIHLFVSSLPMTYNTAVLFLLTGLAFIALNIAKDIYLPIIAGGLILMASLALLSQDLFNLNLGLDQLIVSAIDIYNIPHPERQAASTSLTFIFIGIALILMGSPLKIRPRPLILGLISAFVLSMALVVCMGYFSGMEGMYRWTTESRMSLLTSLLMLLVGAGILLRALSSLAQSGYKDFSIWFSIPVSVCTIATILSFWYSLKNQDLMRLHEAEMVEVTQIKNILSESIKNIVTTLKLTAQNIEVEENFLDILSKTSTWQSIQKIQGFKTLQWISQNGKNDFVLPIEAKVIQDVVQGKNFENENTMGTPTLSFSRNLFGDAQNGLIITIPVFHNRIFEGIIKASFNIYDIFHETLKDYDTQTYSIRIFDRNGNIYVQDSKEVLHQQSDAIKIPLNIYEFHWTVQAISMIGFLSKHQTQVHIISLAESVVMASLVLLAMHFAQTARIRSKEVENSLKLLKAAQKRLVTQEKLASLGALTAGIAHEIKNPLNFINNFSSLSLNLLPTLERSLNPIPISGKQESFECLETLKINIETICRHSKRVNSIVERMMAHSSSQAPNRTTCHINLLLEDAISSFLKGVDIQYPGMSVGIKKMLDPKVGTLEIVVEEIRQVFLNILSNACYALSQKKQKLGDAFSPQIEVTTLSFSDKVEIRFKDNGMGISAKNGLKIFTPFFTTKPPGLGIGLGLSLCHDIIVQKHDGSIFFQTKDGEFAEFVISLPLALTNAHLVHA